MTTLPVGLRAPAWERAGLLLLALSAAALGRAALNGHSAQTAFPAGLAFGLVLLAAALAAGWRFKRPSVRAVLLGLAGGMLLIAVPRVLHPGVPVTIGMRPEPFVAWVAVTTLVAVAEEVLLRGALFDAMRDAAGLPAAVILTSVAFALMHVPLYGWSVVPIDLAAGIWLAGLRLTSRSVAAPAGAHLLADLAGWWL